MIPTDKFFQGENKTHPFFEGWYFKHQIGNNVYAFIPGYSIAENGEKSPFIQVISHEHSEIFYFDSAQLFIEKEHLFIKIGENIFSEKGISLSLTNGNLSIHGTIDYGDFTPIHRTYYAPSIMGPFSYFAFMECYHGILSMKHSLQGELVWNDQPIDFDQGIGYIEKDWGSSFPATYVWPSVINLRRPMHVFSFLQQKFHFLVDVFWESSQFCRSRAKNIALLLTTELKFYRSSKKKTI